MTDDARRAPRDPMADSLLRPPAPPRVAVPLAPSADLKPVVSPEPIPTSLVREDDTPAQGGNIGRGLLVTSYAISGAIAPGALFLSQSLTVMWLLILVAFCAAWVTRLFHTGWPERRFGYGFYAQATAAIAGLGWMALYAVVDPTWTLPRSTPLAQARPGDCVSAPRDVESLQLEDPVTGSFVVACDAPHWGQVYATLAPSAVSVTQGSRLESDACFDEPRLEHIAASLRDPELVVPLVVTQSTGDGGAQDYAYDSKLLCLVVSGSDNFTGDYYVGS